MTIEKRLMDFGVRIVNTKKSFAEENKDELEEILFINSATESRFKIFAAEGFKEIEILKKKGNLINFEDQRWHLLFVTHNWVMVADLDTSRMILCKIV